MPKPAVNLSFESLERCRSRLLERRRRHTKLRQLILQHLTGEAREPPICDDVDTSLKSRTASQPTSFIQRKSKMEKSCFVSSLALFDYTLVDRILGTILWFIRSTSLLFHYRPVVRRLKPPILSKSTWKLFLRGDDQSVPVILWDGSIIRTQRSQTSPRSADLKPKDSQFEKGYTVSSTFLKRTPLPCHVSFSSSFKLPFFMAFYTRLVIFPFKGTQSANPHNDYCQHFVDTGERPQNFIRDTGLKNRFEEYPKLRELIHLKDELIQARATPPMYLRADLLTFDLRELNSVFDVILIEPPLEEYNKTAGMLGARTWSWLEIERLEIEKIAAPRSFIWIWCGSGEGLEGARKCFRKWGFRRCEDICWIKSNKNNPGHEQLEPGAIFQRTKEHCLMGIHGTVRRSTDGDFIHANLDIDLIISEAKPPGSYAASDRPTEIFHIIEHFCQGRRRLHLFGRDSTLRAASFFAYLCTFKDNGWLTVGSELSASNFDPQVYNGYFNREPNGHLLGTSEEIERLRPKSPPPRFSGPASGRAVGSGGPSSSSAPPSHAVALAAAASLMVPSAATTVPPAKSSALTPDPSSHPPLPIGPSLLGLPSAVPTFRSEVGVTNRRSTSGPRNRGTGPSGVLNTNISNLLSPSSTSSSSSTTAASSALLSALLFGASGAGRKGILPATGVQNPSLNPSWFFGDGASRPGSVLTASKLALLAASVGKSGVGGGGNSSSGGGGGSLAALQATAAATATMLGSLQHRPPSGTRSRGHPLNLRVLAAEGSGGSSGYRGNHQRGLGGSGGAAGGPLGVDFDPRGGGRPDAVFPPSQPPASPIAALTPPLLGGGAVAGDAFAAMRMFFAAAAASSRTGGGGGLGFPDDGMNGSGSSADRVANCLCVRPMTAFNVVLRATTGRLPCLAETTAIRSRKPELCKQLDHVIDLLLLCKNRQWTEILENILFLQYFREAVRVIKFDTSVAPEDRAIVAPIRIRMSPTSKRQDDFWESIAVDNTEGPCRLD
ncbi:unnamed protein product [Schistocephalus solidus]|uniref:N(6)-adenosine-methyltransferase non-catalytic subunit METTL14 n=1 Tax=Schistocephalus solidus TaxID=70667 RepID=A0A183SGT7_SCHSO|nr:unnamed protein product [Schistocephalus solidus]